MGFIKFKTGTYGQQIHLEEAGTLPMNPETPVPEEYKEAEPLVAKLIEMGNDVEWRYKSIDAISYTTANNAMNTLFPRAGGWHHYCRRNVQAADRSR